MVALSATTVAVVVIAVVLAFTTISAAMPEIVVKTE
jgi:hypothetical protein